MTRLTIVMTPDVAAGTQLGRCKGTLAACLLSLAACDPGGDRAVQWTGTVDTLSSGQIVVDNSENPAWRSGEEWQVVEELRIGGVGGTGPEVFGNIGSIAVDPLDRIWVLDFQAQELRIFDADGEHVRTVGRPGGGPGEFNQAVHVGVALDGDIWVMDPSNARLSVFDTAGVYAEGKPAPGGGWMLPWPGRFDNGGRYYVPVSHEGRTTVVRFNDEFQVVDSLAIPSDPVPRGLIEIRDDQGRAMMTVPVPYQGSLTWRISPIGTMWAMITDQYRLFELNADGDTLRTITRAFTPPPVTTADRDRAQEEVQWLIDQGAAFDPASLPRTKPPVQHFFFDEESHIWVELAAADDDELSPMVDVFDQEGRFLGSLRLPFVRSTMVPPIFRDGRVYTVIHDDLDVQYVVRARIERQREPT